MKKPHPLALILTLSVLMASCGSSEEGKNEGGGEIVPDDAGAWLTFSPARLIATAHPDESIYVHLQATVNDLPDLGTGSASPEVQVGIVDSTDTFQPTVTLTTSEDGERHLLTLQTIWADAVGTRSGILEIRVCQDTPTICSKPYPGSPWRLPFQIDIRPGSRTALSAVPGLAPWTTFQGNAAHTGHVAGTFSPANFRLRWAWRYGYTGATDITHSVAVSNGLLMATDSSNRVHALSEDTGLRQWETTFPTADLPIQMINPPAVANGKVYVMTTYVDKTVMQVLNQNTGKWLADQSLSSSRWVGYLAPTVYGDGVYTGYAFGLAKFDATSNTSSWRVGRAQHDQWTPAVDGQYAYSHTGDALIAAHTSTGKTAFSIKNPSNPFPALDMPGSPVIVAYGLVCYVQNFFLRNLICMDTINARMAWSQSDSSMTTPAAAHGVLYTRTSSAVTARRASDGTLLWSWPIPEGQYNWRKDPVVVTDNLAFVSTASMVHAIDLSTHQTVWSYPQSGSLAISEQGVLYIVSHTGTLVAINLK